MPQMDGPSTEIDFHLYSCTMYKLDVDFDSQCKVYFRDMGEELELFRQRPKGRDKKFHLDNSF